MSLNFSKDSASQIPNFPASNSDDGAESVVRYYQGGTDEVKNLLKNECSVIYECSCCRSLFRSIINFVAHKRTICRTLLSSIRTEQAELVRDSQKTNQKGNSEKDSDSVNNGQRKIAKANRNLNLRRFNPTSNLVRHIRAVNVHLERTNTDVEVQTLPKIVRKPAETTIVDGKQSVPENRVALVMPRECSVRCGEMQLRRRRGTQMSKTRPNEGKVCELTSEEIEIIERIPSAMPVDFTTNHCEDQRCLARGLLPFGSLNSLAHHLAIQHQLDFSEEGMLKQTAKKAFIKCFLCDIPPFHCLADLQKHFNAAHSIVRQHHNRFRMEQTNGENSARRKAPSPSEFRSLSPIRSPPKDKKEEGKEMNEEDDREAEENATEVKKATGAKTLIRRPISFTPICKEEEQKQHFEAALALRDWVRNKIRESANSENGRFEEGEGEEDDDTDEVPPLPKVPAKKAENSLLKRKSAKSSSSKNRKRPKISHSHKALPQAKANGNSIDGTNSEKRGSACASSTAAATAKNDGAIPMEDFVLPAQIKETVPKTDAAEAPLLISEVDDGGTAIEEGPKNDGPSEGSGTDETEEKRRSAPPQLTKECLPTMVTGRYREDLIFYTPKARAKIREKEMQRLSSGSSRRKQIFSSMELTESDAISLVGSSTSTSKDQQKTDSDDKSVPPPPKPKDLGQVPVYLTEHQRDLFFKPLKPLFNLNTVDDGFWQCGECGEVLKNIRDGRRHMVSHIRVMRMRCSLCDAGAFFCSDMRVHLMYRHCDKLNLAPDDFISPGTPCMSREKADLLTQLVDPYHPGRVMYTTGKIVSWANPKAYFPDPKSERNILGPALPGY
ncbi:hypothetical protein niasHT_011237 [Heterodera trifolii]|uniref:C2H2-type domain-containing protein n=1 Tax=Heterodera trifolii TaxID=157864 RepID=A0ABD2L681_9BILA